MLGYVYSPRVLAHDPPPATLQIAGRDFTLGSANVAQAALTAQAHELVERSALGRALARIAPVAGARGGAARGPYGGVPRPAARRERGRAVGRRVRAGDPGDRGTRPG